MTEEMILIEIHHVRLIAILAMVLGVLGILSFCAAIWIGTKNMHLLREIKKGQKVGDTLLINQKKFITKLEAYDKVLDSLRTYVRETNIIAHDWQSYNRMQELKNTNKSKANAKSNSNPIQHVNINGHKTPADFEHSLVNKMGELRQKDAEKIHRLEQENTRIEDLEKLVSELLLKLQNKEVSE